MYHPNMELIGRPDLHEVLVEYLHSSLDERPEAYTDNVKVSVTKPLSGSVPYVTVTVLDGIDLDLFRSRGYIDIEIAHSTRADALNLANMVNALMRRAPLKTNGIAHISTEAGLIPVADDEQTYCYAQTYLYISRAVVLPEVDSTDTNA